MEFDPYFYGVNFHENTDYINWIGLDKPLVDNENERSPAAKYITSITPELVLALLSVIESARKLDGLIGKNKNETFWYLNSDDFESAMNRLNHFFEWVELDEHP